MVSSLLLRVLYNMPMHMRATWRKLSMLYIVFVCYSAHTLVSTKLQSKVYQNNVLLCFPLLLQFVYYILFCSHVRAWVVSTFLHSVLYVVLAERQYSVKRSMCISLLYCAVYICLWVKVYSLYEYADATADTHKYFDGGRNSVLNCTAWC